MEFKKRGQLSFFVLAGIVIIIALSILFYFSTLNVNKPEIDTIVLSFDIKEIEDRIDSCLKEMMPKIADLMASNGGFIDLKNAPFKMEFSFIKDEWRKTVAYGLFEDKIVLIGNDGLEYQIENYLEENIPLCARVNNLGVDYEGKINVVAKVMPDNINVNVVYPLIFKKGDLTWKTRDKYMLNLKSKLGLMRDLSQEIVEQQNRNNGFISFSDLDAKGIKISMNPVDKDTTVFLLNDESSSLSFMFGSGRRNE